MQKKRTILYVESDDHGGNIRGLMSPDTRLPDDNLILELANDEDLSFTEAELMVISDPKEFDYCYHSPKLRSFQLYLNKLRNRNLEWLVDLSAGDEILYLHLGDITQGQKYVSDWVTTRIGDQFLIALANHRPIMELPNLKAARYVEGTSSHVFGDGTSGGVVTAQLKAEYPEIDVKPIHHGLIEYNGLLIDCAHHGPGPGSRKWLEGNIASYYIRDRMMKDLLRGRNPADLFLRAHFHTWARAFWNISIDDKDYISEICLMPSMCGLNCYGRQVTKSVEQITNGALAFEIYGDKILDVHRWTKTLDLRNYEVIA